MCAKAGPNHHSPSRRAWLDCGANDRHRLCIGGRALGWDSSTRSRTAIAASRCSVSGPSNYIKELKQETTTIPIVMLGSGDPVGYGLVTNLARPEANVTGVA